MQAHLGERWANRAGVHKTDTLRLPPGLFPILRPRQSGETVGNVSLPDPPRDEDFDDDPVVEFAEHHCVVLTPDKWMCEDCGVVFDRDPSWGDEPEEAIIEGGAVCVAYTPDG